jgi:energy-coupling factor transport system ATP-binding protein
MAVIARTEKLCFTYPERPEAALRKISLEIEEGEIVLVLGRSGSGKSTLIRALSGLVPHFHGGRFSGTVEIGGKDTRRASPSELAGTVATLFQDPEDQIVFDRVESEVAFGPENLGLESHPIGERAETALDAVGALHLFARTTGALSGGELQRVCLASALALEPRLLLLDEPISQLDPEGARAFLDLIERLAHERRMAVVLCEQRPALPLELCERVLFLEGGRLLLDADSERALAWLEEKEPEFVRPLERASRETDTTGEPVCSVERASFSYEPGVSVLDDVSLELRRGEIVALTGPNGSGKTTLAKIACGLLEAQTGRVDLRGRVAYLSQDPGRYVVCERVEDEVSLAIGGDSERARYWLERLGLGGCENRHPRDLSSGERERLGLAAVLATDPDLLVLDEPTRGVDPGRKRELVELFGELAPERSTLLVTHDLGLVRSLADRTIRLEEPVTEPVHA